MEYIYNKGVLPAKLTGSTKGLHRRYTDYIPTIQRRQNVTTPALPYPTLWGVAYI